VIKAALFDVGGVLHTSHSDPEKEKFFANEALKTLADHGIPLNTKADEFFAAVEKRAKEYKKQSEIDLKELAPARVWAGFLKDFSVSEESLVPCAERLCYLFDAERKLIEKRPGLIETAKALKDLGMKLGIISNILSAEFVHERLELYGIASFMDTVVTSIETGIRKPDKRIFEIAADRLGLAPADCAYIGDRISRDVMGSHNAGIGMVILVHYPESEKKDARLVSPANEPDFRVDLLAEVPALIEKANEKAARHA
jgi:putative hydrolase of the HAD superfamily